MGRKYFYRPACSSMGWPGAEVRSPKLNPSHLVGDKNPVPCAIPAASLGLHVWAAGVRSQSLELNLGMQMC